MYYCAVLYALNALGVNEMIKDTIDYLNTYTDGFEPEIGIVLGSGLGELADEYSEFAIPYSKFLILQNQPLMVIKVILFFATIEGRKVVMMQGRKSLL